MTTTFSNNTTARKIIMSHYSNPTFLKKVGKSVLNVNMQKFASEPTCCADEITIFIDNTNQKINDVFFDGFGCAVVVSATDLLLKHVLGQPFAAVKTLLQKFSAMLLQSANELDDHELSVFKNVAKHQNRIECALTPARIIAKAITTGAPN